LDKSNLEKRKSRVNDDMLGPYYRHPHIYQLLYRR
jgi:hypothetical protein